MLTLISTNTEIRQNIYEGIKIMLVFDIFNSYNRFDISSKHINFRFYIRFYTKFWLGLPNFWSALPIFLVSTTKFDCADQKFGSPNQHFGSAEQKFGYLNPHHFLAGLTKNEGQESTQPNRYLLVLTLTKGWKRLQNFYESILIEKHFVRVETTK